MKNKLFIILIILLITNTSYGQISIQIPPINSKTKYFLHNMARIGVGVISPAPLTFVLMMYEGGLGPIFVFPLANSAGVYLTGKAQKYDGKFWSTVLGSYVSGLPICIALHYSLKHSITEFQAIALLAGLLVIPSISGNIGFNLTTRNKNEVLNSYYENGHLNNSDLTLSDNYYSKSVHRNIYYKIPILIIKF